MKFLFLFAVLGLWGRAALGDFGPNGDKINCSATATMSQKLVQETNKKRLVSSLALKIQDMPRLKLSNKTFELEPGGTFISGHAFETETTVDGKTISIRAYTKESDVEGPVKINTIDVTVMGKDKQDVSHYYCLPENLSGGSKGGRQGTSP